MQGLAGDPMWFWCPVCGTVKQGQQTDHYDVPSVSPAANLGRVAYVAHLFTSAALCNSVNAMKYELARRGIDDTREPLDDPMGRG